MISDFPHTPPDGYYYDFEKFNSRLISIWICSTRKFHYNDGKLTKSIWGFYSPSKKEYYSPINSSKPGDVVDIKKTRNYTSMQINLNPLEIALL